MMFFGASAGHPDEAENPFDESLDPENEGSE
jgi:hypothetical protein